MTKYVKFAFVAVLIASSTLVGGCSPTLDKNSVRAGNTAPDGSQVDEVSIPYDAKYPKYAVAVEPFNIALESEISETSIESSGSSNGSKHCENGKCSGKSGTTINSEYKRVGNGVTAQMETALSNSGNLSVIDKSMVRKNSSGVYTAKLKKGEKGPYIIKGTISELDENAEGSTDSTNVSLGWLGVVGGVAGAVSGSDALMWSGAGLAAADPSYNSEEKEMTGLVVFDIKVIEGSSGRIVKSFKVTGTFTAKSVSGGMGLFGISKQKSAFAKSAIGQAMRVAMNDAVVKVTDALKGL